MKKWISVLLTLTTLLTVMAVFALPASALTTSGTCGAEGDGSNLTWTVDINTGVLEIKGEGAMEDYARVPEVPWGDYGEYIKTVKLPEGLTNIGDYAFVPCYKVKNITIPNSVTAIGKSAFGSCDELASVTIPNSVTYIDEHAFRWCTNLKNITLPDSVIWIGSQAFYETGYYKDKSNWTDGVLYINRHLIRADSRSVSGKYTIKDGTLTIADYGMAECENLTDLTMPDSVVAIGNSAFSDCYDLTSMTISAGVKTIGEDAFAYCYALTNVYISDLYAWCTISCPNSSYALWTGVDLHLDGQLLDRLVIPDGVTAVDDYRFSRCHSLTSVVIPDNLTTIGVGAFQGCFNLASVVIGNGVTEIGESAFDKVKKLEKVYIKSPAIANQLTSSQACGDLLKYTPSVMIADEITSVPEFIIENYPYTTSETYDGVAYTVYTKIAPPPETTPDEGGEVTTAPVVTDKPTTDAPVVTDTPTTDTPSTDAPVTATPPSTTTKTPTVSSTDSEVNPPADSDGGGDSLMLTVIAVLLVCLIGAVATLTAVVLKKK